MIDLESKIQNLKSQIAGGLIVSCQAPSGSPLAKPEIIAALAAVAEQNGAVGVRIDSPPHVLAVKQMVKVPVFGIYKIVSRESEVYITPTYASATEIAVAGCDVVAIDATSRPRPQDEKLADIIKRIKSDLNLPVMADVATLDEGLKAADLAIDFISTTLSGYTHDTKHVTKPDFELIEDLARTIDVPILSEGRLRTPDDVRRAFESGAFAIVIGGAITGVDQLVQQFVSATPRQRN